MLVTSGDIYFTLVTAGLTAAFTGVGLLVSRSWRARLCGGGLVAAGIGTVLAPMVGIVALIARILPVT